jgi:hypothetical protein
MRFPSRSTYINEALNWRVLLIHISLPWPSDLSDAERKQAEAREYEQPDVDDASSEAVSMSTRRRITIVEKLRQESPAFLASIRYVNPRTKLNRIPAHGSHGVY